MFARVAVVLVCLVISASPAFAETSVTPDPVANAIIIDGFEPATSRDASGSEPCVEYVLVPQEGVLPADSVVGRPCQESPTFFSRVSDALRERVVRYLPAQRPRIWPESTALVNLPVVAASGQRSIRLYARVLDDQVTIDLSPSFQWLWGDGTQLRTAFAGRAYPRREITHTYRRACRCSIQLVTEWSGSWSGSDGITHPLGATLTQQSLIPLRVRQAPIRLTR